MFKKDLLKGKSILITGGRNREQINKSYNFINRVLKENYDDVRKKHKELPLIVAGFSFFIESIKCL